MMYVNNVKSIRTLYCASHVCNEIQSEWDDTLGDLLRTCTWVGWQWVNSLVIWYHVHSPVAVFHSYPIIFIFLYRRTRIHVRSIHILVATHQSHIPSNMNTFGEQ